MLTVVWDVDDVLNDLTYQWFVYGWLAEHSDCRISYNELTCNPPHDVLGVDRSEYLSSMDDFRRTERARNMAPNREVLTWFRKEPGVHWFSGFGDQPEIVAAVAAEISQYLAGDAAPPLAPPAKY